VADLTWRPPTRDDDPEWADLLAAIELVDRHGETYELADLADEWSSVWSAATEDAVFAWQGGELVAFGWLKTMRGQREHHRVECWGGVRPSHRGRGIGRELLGRQVARATEIAATLDPSLATTIRLEALDTQHDLLALAARFGFEPVRRFLEVARPVTDPPMAVVPEGVELLPWSADIDDATRLAHTDSFADHWGSEPRTVEEWKQWYTGHRCFRADLSRVAVERASGDAVAFALCAAYPQDWHLVPRETWLNSLGTRRAWRGRGVARALISEVLRAVAAADDGFERTILGVDADNPTGALHLYRSLGFEDVRAMQTLSLSP
jgi:ribosomal protein S18 acetylase RimI-like enzyme